MSRDTEYNERLAKHILQDVFRELWFPNEKIRNILFDTYVANIPVMNRYIAETKTDLRAYYYNIKQILLCTSGATLRSKRLEKQR